MKNLLKAIILLLALAPMGAWAQATDYDANLLRPGTKAPDFKIISARTGDTLTLANMLKQPLYILIDFWASWCPDCRRDVPQLKDLAKAYGNYGLSVLGVSFDTDSAAWKRYIRKEKLDWVHGSELKKWKHGTTIDSLYHVTWIPTMYLVDPDGTVAFATVSIEKMRHAIDSLAAAGAVTKNMMPAYGNDGEGNYGSVVDYFEANLHYPETARLLEVEGKVMVNFFVEEDGSVGEATIKGTPEFVVPKKSKRIKDEAQWRKAVEAAKGALEGEALRVVRQMPDWKPAIINGRKARVRMTLPVRFALK